MSKLALFLSGSGSNAENIIKYFQSNDDINVAFVLSDRSEAFGLERAKKYDIPAYYIGKDEFLNSDIAIDLLKQHNIDLIVLAGFLCYVPQGIITHFSGRIINIHPSLLPKYGGKGMYGRKVHQAVVANNEKESGISIHYVNEKFDDGEMIFQAKCDVLPDDTSEIVESKVRALEIEHFPRIVDEVLLKLK